MQKPQKHTNDSREGLTLGILVHMRLICTRATTTVNVQKKNHKNNPLLQIKRVLSMQTMNSTQAKITVVALSCIGTW